MQKWFLKLFQSGPVKWNIITLYKHSRVLPSPDTPCAHTVTCHFAPAVNWGPSESYHGAGRRGCIVFYVWTSYVLDVVNQCVVIKHTHCLERQKKWFDGQILHSDPRKWDNDLNFKATSNFWLHSLHNSTFNIYMYLCAWIWTCHGLRNHTTPLFSFAFAFIEYILFVSFVFPLMSCLAYF